MSRLAGHPKGTQRPSRAAAESRATIARSSLPAARARATPGRRSRQRACASFGGLGRLGEVAFQRRSDALRDMGELVTIDVARTRQWNPEFIAESSRARRQQEHAVGKAHRFTNIVSDEDDGLTPPLPCPECRSRVARA